MQLIILLQLESILDINITQTGIDECVTAACTHSSGCVSKHEQNHVPTITTAGSVSLVSVTVLSHAVCGCAARENPHLSCSSYQTNPCLNGGTCVDTDLGYRLVKLHKVCKHNASSADCIEGWVKASGTITSCLPTVANLSFVILHTKVLQKNLYSWVHIIYVQHSLQENLGNIPGCTNSINATLQNALSLCSLP